LDFPGVRYQFAMSEWVIVLYLINDLIRYCHANPHISPVSRNLAPDRCRWVPGWTEGHSGSYGLKG